MAALEVSMKTPTALLSVTVVLGSILAAGQALAQASPNHVTVPEPSTLAVLAAGVVGLGVWRYLKKK